MKIKTLSEELQDYKVKSVKGLQDYKRGRIKKFFREFQLMASAPDNSSLLSDQDTNQF